MRRTMYLRSSDNDWINQAPRDPRDDDRVEKNKPETKEDPRDNDKESPKKVD
jgi:hypothetical protein